MDRLQNMIKLENEICIGYMWNTPFIHVCKTPISKEVTQMWRNLTII